jgi:16S rRNA (cytidine1402-2'-O)-methyltransferase
MSGILYVVATPIGNLEDVTLRALRILREVSIIAAEDTRRTARLLQHYSISTPTTSLREHNERRQTAALIGRLEKGESVALVSDAGTPLVSDPGQALVSAVRTAGLRVEAIPGPSAVMAILSAAGVPASEFTFLGFPPTRLNDRKRWLSVVATEPRPLIFFEAPHRLQGTLVDISRVIDLNHTLFVGRELTKAHEELVVRPITGLLEYFAEPRGEFTLLIPPGGRTEGTVKPPNERQLATELGELTNNGRLRRREALKIIGRKYGLTPNELYKLVGKKP